MDGVGVGNNTLSILCHGPQLDTKKTLKTNTSKFIDDDVEGWLYKVKN